MDQSIGNIDFLSVTDINVETIMKKKNNARKSNKCSQCSYASFQAGDSTYMTYKNSQWRKVKQMQPV